MSAVQEHKTREQGLDTKQVQEAYKIVAFAAPYVEVVRKSDGQKGFLEFQHHPRVYYNFVAS